MSHLSRDYAATWAVCRGKNGSTEPFVAKLPNDADDSINFHEFVIRQIGHSKFFLNFADYSPSPDTSKSWGLRTPGKHRSVLMSQGKG
jgi:hypothetical protein